ncbi:unnamed protein product [Prunus armeniaca]
MLTIVLDGVFQQLAESEEKGNHLAILLSKLLHTLQGNFAKPGFWWIEEEIERILRDFKEEPWLFPDVASGFSERNQPAVMKKASLRFLVLQRFSRPRCEMEPAKIKKGQPVLGTRAHKRNKLENEKEKEGRKKK